MPNDDFSWALEDGSNVTIGEDRVPATLLLDPSTGANMIAFESGWGDGRYASYWGLDRDGAPVCLLTDFEVVNMDESKRRAGEIISLVLLEAAN